MNPAAKASERVQVRRNVAQDEVFGESGGAYAGGMGEADRAKELLMEAHALYGERQVDEALAKLDEALDVKPDYVDAWSFKGTTLVTRKMAFEEGLAALEKAAELAPDDAGIVYGLGWCYEFVAYRLERSASPPYRDPVELYHKAAACLQKVIDLQPEQALQDDAADLMTAIEARLDREP